jgi:hypothetical protein
MNHLNKPVVSYKHPLEESEKSFETHSMSYKHPLEESEKSLETHSMSFNVIE